MGPLDIAATHEYLDVALDPRTTSPGKEIFALCLLGYLRRINPDPERGRGRGRFQITREGLKQRRAA